MPFHFVELILPLLFILCVVIFLSIVIGRLRRPQEHPQQSEDIFQTYQQGYQEVRQSPSITPNETGTANQNVPPQYEQAQAEYPQIHYPDERLLQ